jgi:hypothetical protein
MGTYNGSLRQSDTGQQQTTCEHGQCGMHELFVAQHRSIGERFGRVFGRDTLSRVRWRVRNLSGLFLNRRCVRGRAAAQPYRRHVYQFELPSFFLH